MALFCGKFFNPRKLTDRMNAATTTTHRNLNFIRDDDAHTHKHKCKFSYDEHTRGHEDCIVDDDGRRLHDKFAQVFENSPKRKKNKKIIERSSMNFSLSHLLCVLMQYSTSGRSVKEIRENFLQKI